MHEHDDISVQSEKIESIKLYFWGFGKLLLVNLALSIRAQTVIFNVYDFHFD